MIKTRFIFAVSFCALMATGVVHADTATGDAVGTVHDVYTDQTPTEGTGIAGVSYVNKAVNKAGAAAEKAEAHAASAGASAISAQESADAAAESAATANTAVAKKQDKSTAAYQMGNSSGGWTTMTSEQQNALNSGITSAKVATYDGYATTIAGKQDKLTTSNIRGSGSVSVGIADGVIIVTGTDNNTTYSTGTASTSGLTKLYTGTGTNTDGTMTQNAITSALSGKVAIAQGTGTNNANVGKVLKVNSSGNLELATDNNNTYTVNDKTLTIQKNSTPVGTFTANSATDKTINITVPTKTSELTNDSTYVTTTGMDEAIAGAVDAATGELTTAINGKLDTSVYTDLVGTVSATNMGTTASTVVGAIKEVAGDAATAQSTADSALAKANAAVVANDAITAGTGTKITYDAKGLVTGSASLVASDIPTLAINKISGLQDALDAKQATLTIDTTLSSSSTNPVQNKVINTALAGKQATISDLATIRSGAAAGATALQKADIATGTSNGTISVDGTNVAVKGLGSAAYTESSAYATAAQGTLAASAVQPGTLADVATSGSYNDLTNKPTIGTSSLTIKNGATNTNIATFGANATTAVTATIPAATASVAGLAKIGIIPSGSDKGSTAEIWVE